MVVAIFTWLYKQTTYTIYIYFPLQDWWKIDQKEKIETKISHKIQNFEYVNIGANMCRVHTATSIIVCTSIRMCQKIWQSKNNKIGWKAIKGKKIKIPIQYTCRLFNNICMHAWAGSYHACNKILDDLISYPNSMI